MARGADGTLTAADVSLGFPNDEDGVLRFAQSRLDNDPALVVSEVLLSSADIPYNGGFADVIELHNRSAEAVSTGTVMSAPASCRSRRASRSGRVVCAESCRLSMYCATACF